jgi:hypothetical protein
VSQNQAGEEPDQSRNYWNGLRIAKLAHCPRSTDPHTDEQRIVSLVH